MALPRMFLTNYQTACVEDQDMSIHLQGQATRARNRLTKMRTASYLSIPEAE